MPRTPMHLKINKRRVRVHPTSGEDEIFRLVHARMCWPKAKAYIVWGDKFQAEVRSEEELRLACRMVSESLYNEAKDWAEEFSKYERKVEKWMNEPDSESDEEVLSEDDITMEDFYTMGFRHEIVN